MFHCPRVQVVVPLLGLRLHENCTDTFAPAFVSSLSLGVRDVITGCAGWSSPCPCPPRCLPLWHTLFCLDDIFVQTRTRGVVGRSSPVPCIPVVTAGPSAVLGRVRLLGPPQQTSHCLDSDPHWSLLGRRDLTERVSGCVRRVH